MFFPREVTQSTFSLKIDTAPITQIAIECRFSRTGLYGIGVLREATY